MSAKIFYDTNRRGWRITGKDGKEKLFISEDNLVLGVAIKSTKGIMEATATLQNVNVGTLAVFQRLGMKTTYDINSNFYLTRLVQQAASLPLTNIGTNSVAVVTLTGTASAGLATNMPVFVSPNVALASGVVLGAAYVPSTNCLNLILSNPNIASVASQPAIGVDIFGVSR